MHSIWYRLYRHFSYLSPRYAHSAVRTHWHGSFFNQYFCHFYSLFMPLHSAQPTNEQYCKHTHQMHLAIAINCIVMLNYAIVLSPSVAFCSNYFCSINWIYSAFNTCNSHCHSIIKLWVWTRLSTEYHAMVICFFVVASFYAVLLASFGRRNLFLWLILCWWRVCSWNCDNMLLCGPSMRLTSLLTFLHHRFYSYWTRCMMCSTEIYIYCVHPCGAIICCLLSFVALLMNE